MPELCENCAELEALFDLRYNADMRAIKRWQAATGRHLTWPDHADLVVWLLKQLDAAEAVIDVARRTGEINVVAPLSDYVEAGLGLALHVVAYDDKYPAKEDDQEERDG